MTKQYKIFNNKIGWGKLASGHYFVGYQIDGTNHMLGLWWFQIYRIPIHPSNPWGHKFQQRIIYNGYDYVEYRDHCGYVLDYHNNSSTTDAEFCCFRKKDHYD